MYQHILLAVALQQWDELTLHALAAREAAVALARGSGARLSVLSVYDYGQMKSLSLSAEEMGRYRESQMSQIDALMGRKMQAFLAGTQEMDAPVTPLLQAGDPHELILSAARTLGVDLLVIGAHNKRGFLDGLMGGTAAHILRVAPCPVLMVQPREQTLRLQSQEQEAEEPLPSTEPLPPI
jgi:nucleotide-binding universal stress UspA family protein